MKNNPEKLYVVKRRDEIMWQLHLEGFSTGDISKMFNNLDRGWVWRLIQRMPKDWEPKFSKHKKAS